MQIKVFSAPRLHEALAKVREGFGPDAVILDRHKTDDDNGKKIWHVYAAKDASSNIQTAANSRHEPHDADFPRGYINAANDHNAIDHYPDVENKDDVRATLPDKKSKHSFDFLTGLGVAPSYASKIAGDFSRKKPIAGNLLTWAKPLEPAKRKELVLLTGPSGGGKTTLAVKLAAHFSMQGVKVAFMSTDTERIGGTSRLAAYADILHIPVTPLKGKTDLAVVMKKTESARLVLVDTEGWTRMQPAKLKRQAKLWSLLPCSRRLLVLPANMDETDGVTSMNQVRPMGIGELAISKLDETSRPGKVINWAATNVSLSYCSFGPEVPDQMGWLSAKALTALLSSHEETEEFV